MLQCFVLRPQGVGSLRGWRKLVSWAPHFIWAISWLTDWQPVKCCVCAQSLSQETRESPSLTSSHKTRPGSFSLTTHSAWINHNSRIGHVFKFCLPDQKAGTRSVLSLLDPSAVTEGVNLHGCAQVSLGYKNTALTP